MSDRRENSVLFSLKELRRIEDDRVRLEQDELAARREAERAAAGAQSVSAAATPFSRRPIARWVERRTSTATGRWSVERGDVGCGGCGMWDVGLSREP